MSLILFRELTIVRVVFGRVRVECLVGLRWLHSSHDVTTTYRRTHRQKPLTVYQPEPDRSTGGQARRE